MLFCHFERSREPFCENAFWYFCKSTQKRILLFFFLDEKEPKSQDETPTPIFFGAHSAGTPEKIVHAKSWLFAKKVHSTFSLRSALHRSFTSPRHTTKFFLIS
jgi:hypothetical protein